MNDHKQWNRGRVWSRGSTNKLATPQGVHPLNRRRMVLTEDDLAVTHGVTSCIREAALLKRVQQLEAHQEELIKYAQLSGLLIKKLCIETGVNFIDYLIENDKEYFERACSDEGVGDLIKEMNKLEDQIKEVKMLKDKS